MFFQEETNINPPATKNPNTTKQKKQADNNQKAPPKHKTKKLDTNHLE